MNNTIEFRIRQHYQADNGEWLVEKGKVKEAKLLKEACEEIEKLRKQYAHSERIYWNLLMSTNEKARALNEREKCIAAREEKFESHKDSFISKFNHLAQI